MIGRRFLRNRLGTIAVGTLLVLFVLNYKTVNLESSKGIDSTQLRLEPKWAENGVSSSAKRPTKIVFWIPPTSSVNKIQIERQTTAVDIAPEQDDSKIIKYIWDHGHIEKPNLSKGYNLKKPLDEPSKGQAQFIRKLLKNQRGGFFIECGALDGETRSNTLSLERDLNWSGLLVEGDPSNYALMKKKNRKSWTSNTCLAVKPYPHMATFLQDFNLGKVLNEDEANQTAKSKQVQVQCLPIYSLLAAINVTEVDYFSLDVEGSELKVLKTIPFDKVHIRTLSVEFSHTTEGEDELKKFMDTQGFAVAGVVKAPKRRAHDYMFVNKDSGLAANN